jgi:hypothetical protein
MRRHPGRADNAVSRLHDLLGQLTDDEPGGCNFTLHVDFLAKDEEQAAFRATLYVEALNTLRTEVDSFRAQVSAESNWSASVPLYCNAPGPDPMDICLESFGHAGRHRGPGATGKWKDDDVPAAPDDTGIFHSADKPGHNPPRHDRELDA